MLWACLPAFLGFVGVMVLEVIGFALGDVGRKRAAPGQHGRVVSLLRLKGGCFKGLNSHLALRASKFVEGI